MSIFDGLLSRLGYVKAGARQQYPEYMLSMARDAAYSLPSAETYQRQATLYQKLTWIATAIDFVANAAAVLSINVKQREGEDLTDIPNHPFEVKLQKPNPLQTEFEFKRDYFSYLRLNGNAYVYLNRKRPEDIPSEYWIIPSHFCTPVPDGNSYLKGYKYDDGISKIPLETWQVMHSKTFSPFNPFVGLSAVESLAVVARGDIAQQAYQTKLFDKDNAKIPGAIAFADMINQPDWERLQKESKEQWGGMNRSGPMWLRGVGAGGVQWLQMALSQKEMQFLEERQFTKEEVWGKLAPGLSSILAINANEANALAGQSIMAEYVLWPMLVPSAQKITTDILPAYSENLVAEFDDPRKANRLVDLEEQREFASVHTVNEIRSEYYGDDEIEGGDVPVSAWQGALTSIAPGNPAADSGTFTDTGNAAAANTEVVGEMKAWENFALRRLGKTGGREFEPRAVPIMQAARIKAALKGAATAEAVRAVFENESTDTRYLADALLAAAKALEETK